MADPDEVATVPDPEAARAGIPPLELERYDIGARIGKGGMGEVWIARDRTIGREVAIKRMLDPDANARSLARFVREARIQGRLDHPAIVPVHELGTDGDGRPYFVMKRLTGNTLREVLRGDAPQQRLLRAFVDVCLAVEYAHERGVIHRDLKPENIVLGDYGEVYVLDWGVAKLVGDTDTPATETATDEPLATRAGAAVGTPGYMAPEQARGQRDLDRRADVYALGCILHEILVGDTYDLPGATRPTGAAAPAGDERARTRTSDIPPELDAACARALVADRDARLGSARELATAVQDYLDGDRDIARRRTLADGHLDRARDALATSDSPDRRASAMREAGVALALDPTRTEAAEIITRLMIEPPAIAPPEVEATLEAERFQLFRRISLPSLLALATLVAITLVIIARTHAPPAETGLILAFSISCILVTLRARASARMHPLLSPLASLGLAAIVAAFARLYPPFMIAPLLAAITTVMTPFTMQYVRLRSSVFMVACMLVAIFVPYLGEVLGWFSSTFTFVPDGVVFHAAALRGPETWQVAIVILYILSTVVFAGWMGHVTRQTERGARRQLHLQAWHLQQLVRR